MSEKKVILDYGCGRGGNYAFLHKRGSYVGVDILEQNISYAQARYGQELFRVVDGETIPYPDASFDEVHLYDVLEHVINLPRVLAEVTRVLRPGGSMFVVVPARVSEKKLLAIRPSYFEEVGHVRILDPEELTTASRALGLERTVCRKNRGMEALMYTILFTLAGSRRIMEHQTGSPQFSKWLVAFIWLFDERLFITPLKYFFFIYIFTLPIGWLVTQVFPKGYTMLFTKKYVA